jgi:hypothetical protein
MVLYAYKCVLVHSRFVENASTWSWETNPSVLRWFYHISDGGGQGSGRRSQIRRRRGGRMAHRRPCMEEKQGRWELCAAMGEKKQKWPHGGSLIDEEGGVGLEGAGTSWHARWRDLCVVQQGHGETDRWARPLHNSDFDFFNYFSNWFVLIPSKGCILLHQIFQIKYVCVDNLIGNKLPHRSFSKFEIEFELKITEPIGA